MKRITDRMYRRPLEHGQSYAFGIRVPLEVLQQHVDEDGCVVFNAHVSREDIIDPNSGNEVLIRTWLCVDTE